MFNSADIMNALGVCLLIWAIYIGVRVVLSRKVGKDVYTLKLGKGEIAPNVTYKEFATSWWAHHGPRASVFTFTALIFTLIVWTGIFGKAWPFVQNFIYSVNVANFVEGIDPTAVYDVMISIVGFLIMTASAGCIIHACMRMYYLTLPPPVETFYTN